jgi:hypothetical protein
MTLTGYLMLVLLLVSSAESAAPADGDVLIRAVGFALTGSDDVEPKISDRAKCVFSINDETFYLSNVQVDRLVIKEWKQDTSFGERKWVTVVLHGDETVYEKTNRGPREDDGFDSMRKVKEVEQGLFKDVRVLSREHKLDLTTDDQDRVGRAWKYIYDHGCVGKMSPF